MGGAGWASGQGTVGQWAKQGEGWVGEGETVGETVDWIEQKMLWVGSTVACLVSVAAGPVALLRFLCRKCDYLLYLYVVFHFVYFPAFEHVLSFVLQFALC